MISLINNKKLLIIEMSILFLQISNLESKNVIGTYLPQDMKNSSLRNELEKKSNELLNSIQADNGTIKKVIDFKTAKDKVIKVFYYTTNSGILYLSFIEISLLSLPKFEENNVYDLLLNLENQNIKKLVDDNGKLTNVGIQNLKFSIEKYQQNNDLDNDEQIHKISLINDHLNDVKNNMKENVKNIMTNMQDMNEIEGKSVSIKDTSLRFRQSSKRLENKMRRSCYRNIAIFISLIIVLGIVIYLLNKTIF